MIVQINPLTSTIAGLSTTGHKISAKRLVESQIVSLVILVDARQEAVYHRYDSLDRLFRSRFAGGRAN
jgi:hypothetical protein